MSKKPKLEERSTPLEKVKECQRAYAAGKLAYARADRLLEELATEVGCGVEILIDDRGKKAVVIDRYKGSTKVFAPAFARRYELKIRP